MFINIPKKNLNLTRKILCLSGRNFYLSKRNYYKHLFNFWDSRMYFKVNIKKNKVLIFLFLPQWFPINDIYNKIHKVNSTF